MNGHLADHKFYVPNENEDNAEKRLMRYVQNTFNVNFGSYEEWYKWTITNYSLFWEAVLKQCDIKLSSPHHKIVEEDVPIAKIPKWFQGARLNYAENCLKNGVDGHIAFIQANSPTEMQFYDYASLRQDVHRLASVMRLKFNVKSGDVVCAYVSNRYETAVAMLATTSLGAVWSSASVDFGAIGVIDRFSQLSPKLFFTSDFAVYKKKIHSLEENINEIVEGLPTLEKVIVIPNTSTNIPTAYTQANKFCTFQETVNLFQSLADTTVYFEQVIDEFLEISEISSVSNDKHAGVIKMLGEKNISTNYDLWHLLHILGKNIRTAGKALCSDDFTSLRSLVRRLFTFVWNAIDMAGGDPRRFVEYVFSFFLHVTGVHNWERNSKLLDLVPASSTTKFSRNAEIKKCVSLRSHAVDTESLMRMPLYRYLLPQHLCNYCLNCSLKTRSLLISGKFAGKVQPYQLNHSTASDYATARKKYFAKSGLALKTMMAALHWNTTRLAEINGERGITSIDDDSYTKARGTNRLNTRKSLVEQKWKRKIVEKTVARKFQLGYGIPDDETEEEDIWELDEDELLQQLLAFQIEDDEMEIVETE